MGSFALDHALSSAGGQCRRNEFLTYILETNVPGLHFNVDGAREAHMIAGHLQNEEDFFNAVIEILEGQGGMPINGGISHSRCLDFLFNFLIKYLRDEETICSVLLDMAEHVKVLPPGNEPLPWDVLNMTLWRDSLCELVKEMMTVEEKCPSLMGTSGVYVLTTSPYTAFLRALAVEIAENPARFFSRFFGPIVLLLH